MLNNKQILFTFFFIVFIHGYLWSQYQNQDTWRVSWAQCDPSDGVLYYYVYRDTIEDITDDSEHLICTKNTQDSMDDPDTVFIDTVYKGVKYFYKVKIEDNNGKSPFSESAIAAYPLILLQNTLTLPESYQYRIDLNHWVRDPDGETDELNWFVNDNSEYSNQENSLTIAVTSNPDSGIFITDTNWMEDDSETVTFSVVDVDNFTDQKTINIKYGTAPPPISPPSPADSLLKIKKVSSVDAFPVPFDGKQHQYIRFVKLIPNSTLYIYNLLGELVFKENIGQTNEFLWYVTNNSGKKIQTGLYLYVVESKGSKSKPKKIVIIR